MPQAGINDLNEELPAESAKRITNKTLDEIKPYLVGSLSYAGHGYHLFAIGEILDGKARKMTEEERDTLFENFTQSFVPDIN